MAVIQRLLEGCLQCAKQASAAREGQGHGAQFAQDLVPSFGGHAATGPGYGGKNFVQSVDPVSRQGNGARDGVDEPTQHDLVGCSGAVAFAELLDGGRLLAVGVVAGSEWPEDLIEGVKQDALVALAALGVALHSR